MGVKEGNNHWNTLSLLECHISQKEGDFFSLVE